VVPTEKESKSSRCRNGQTLCVSQSRGKTRMEAVARKAGSLGKVYERELGSRPQNRSHARRKEKFHVEGIPHRIPFVASVRVRKQNSTNDLKGLPVRGKGAFWGSSPGTDFPLALSNSIEGQFHDELRSKPNRQHRDDRR